MQDLIDGYEGAVDSASTAQADQPGPGGWSSSSSRGAGTDARAGRRCPSPRHRRRTRGSRRRGTPSSPLLLCRRRRAAWISPALRKSWAVPRGSRREEEVLGEEEEAGGRGLKFKMGRRDEAGPEAEAEAEAEGRREEKGTAESVERSGGGSVGPWETGTLGGRPDDGNGFKIRGYKDYKPVSARLMLNLYLHLLPATSSVCYLNPLPTGLWHPRVHPRAQYPQVIILYTGAGLC
jgi:hypothetical protein